MKKMFWTALAATMLTACSSGPSTQDVKDALRKQMTAIAGQQGADMFSKEIDSIKVMNCQSANNGYECDVEAMGGVQHRRFVKTSDGWAIAQ